MNFRVTIVETDETGYKAQVRRFDRWEDAALWFGHCLAQDLGRAVVVSNETTGKIIVTTTPDWRTLGV